MAKNFLQFYADFEQDFIENAVPKIREALINDNKIIKHNTLVEIRKAYQSKFETSYNSTIWNSPISPLNPIEVPYYANLFASDLLNKYMKETSPN